MFGDFGGVLGLSGVWGVLGFRVLGVLGVWRFCGVTVFGGFGVFVGYG